MKKRTGTIHRPNAQTDPKISPLFTSVLLVQGEDGDVLLSFTR